MRIFIKQFFESIKYLYVFDLIIFIVFISLKTIDPLNREMQVYLAILIIRKFMFELRFSKQIEIIFFLSGSKINKLVFLNFILNNFLFLIITGFMILLEVTTFELFLDNIIILNILFCISVGLRFYINNLNINNHFLKEFIVIFVYFLLFGFFNINLKYSFSIAVVAYLYLFIFDIKTLKYNDLTS